jgi:imidazolonepropionase-like amidohydrolase
VPTLVVSESMLLSGKHDGKAFEAGTSEEERLDALRASARAAVAFHRQGGLLGLGTDFPVDGVPVGESVHREMELFVEHGGATPLEALQIATLSSSRVLGFEELVGTVEPGRIANLVVLRENPLERISATRAIAYVVHDGRIRVQPDEQADSAAPAAPAADDEEK